MIDGAHVRLMARYNRWQNDNLYRVAESLGDDARNRERGAFFGSIRGTLSHLLWADAMWMSRFTDLERPPGGIAESVALYPDWDGLKCERELMDGRIIDWAEGVDEDWLAGSLTFFSAAAQREITRPRWQFAVHFFNHQTHHRGQVHAMLTQAGGMPNDTDLALMPE